MVSFSRSVLLSSSSVVRSSTLRAVVAADAFQLVDDPGFDLIAEFFQIDIEFFRFTFIVAEHIDGITCQLLGQFDVYAFPADGRDT